MVAGKLARKFAFVACVAALFQASTISGARAESDLSGVWLPDIGDQRRQETANMPPWKPEILKQIKHLIAEEKAGRPFLVLGHCLPHGMSSQAGC
jgi:hypothetical protein